MSYVLQWMFEKNEKKKVRNKFTQQQWWWEIIKCSCVNANHSTNYWHKQCVWRGEIFNCRRCRANQTNGMILLFINLLSSTLLFFCMNISLFISGRFYFFAHAQVECSNDFFSVDFSLEWTVCLCVTVYQADRCRPIDRPQQQHQNHWKRFFFSSSSLVCYEPNDLYSNVCNENQIFVIWWYES